MACALVSAPAFAQPEAAPELPSPTDPWGAGYHNGNFYVRSPDDVFRLYVQGRVHVDAYDAFGPGLGGLAPGQYVAPGFILRRARLEIGGEFFQLWQWQLGAEFAPSSADNPAANTASLACKVDGATGAQTCIPVENPVDNPSVKPAPTDAFVNFAPSPWANVMVGQFYVPITLENRISDNTMTFLERGIVIRDLAAPTLRDIGALFWGESPDRVIYYAVGLIDGDGPNRPNADSRFDGTGRVFARPLMRLMPSSGTRWAQVGASVRGGSRDASKVGYDMPALTTQQGFAFWKPTYIDSNGHLTHIIPSAAQWGAGADLYVPVGDFDLSGEFFYADYQTREAGDGLQLSPFTQRLGELKGWGYYAQVGYWILGDHDVIGHPSYQRPIHVDLTKPQAPPKHGVEVLVKVEQLGLKYAGSSRGGFDDPRTPSGDVDVTSFSLGANYWATRHLRVSGDYVYYKLPTTSSVSELHELSGRVGVQF